MQEDKEGFSKRDLLFNLGKTSSPIRVTALDGCSLIKTDFSNATELADYLAKNGVPFRQAHAIAGKLVLHQIKQQLVGRSDHQRYGPIFLGSIQPYQDFSFGA